MEKKDEWVEWSLLFSFINLIGLHVRRQIVSRAKLPYMSGLQKSGA